MASHASEVLGWRLTLNTTSKKKQLPSEKELFFCEDNENDNHYPGGANAVHEIKEWMDGGSAVHHFGCVGISACG